MKTVKSAVGQSNFSWNAAIPEKSRASRYGATTIKLFEKGLNPVEIATITGHKDADAVYPFKSRGFGGEVGVVKITKLRNSA